jgi:hypothetical protein
MANINIAELEKSRRSARNSGLVSDWLQDDSDEAYDVTDGAEDADAEEHDLETEAESLPVGLVNRDEETLGALDEVANAHGLPPTEGRRGFKSFTNH